MVVSLALAAGYSRPGQTQRVSVAPDGTERGGDTGNGTPVVSQDGRFLAFSSGAALVPEDNNICLDGFQNPIGCEDVYVKDLRTGALTRVSVSTTGAQGNSFSLFPAISANGRFVAFQSLSSTLITGGGDTNGKYDIYVRDRDTDANGIYDEPGAVKTVRVSVSSSGAQSSHTTERPSISADGRHVAFGSGIHGFQQSTLVPSDTNGGGDVFVRDRDADGNGIFDEAGEGKNLTTLVSVSTEGTQAVAPRTTSLQFIFAHGVSSISASGRYVVFDTDANNLVAGEAANDNDTDVFLRDRDADGNGIFDEVGSGKNSTIRISVPAAGGQPAGGNQFTASDGSISGDGRYVAFQSAYNNLVPSDTNGTDDIFVRDRDSDGNGIFDEPNGVAVSRVNVASDGTQASGACRNPFITPNGRYITFHSDASNLVPGDTNAKFDQFVHDRETGITERFSVATDGTQGNNHAYAYYFGYYNLTGIADDARYAGFGSIATNLVPNDTNSSPDIFLRDRGPAIGVSGLAASVTSNQIAVSGRATFSGLMMSQASDPANDGIAGANDVGGELIGASITYRGEEEALFVRLKLLSLPNTDIFDIGIDGARGTVYALRFGIAGVTYEMRATAASERAPVFELFRCETACVPQGLITGSYGTTGREVIMVLPLATLGATEGNPVINLNAFTAPADSTAGVSYDTLLLSNTMIPSKSAAVGIAAAGVPEDQVNFDTVVNFSNGSFTATVDASSFAPGIYDVWARACLGATCSAASTPVTLDGGGSTPTPTPSPTPTATPTPTPTPSATPTPTATPSPTPTPDPCNVPAPTPTPPLSRVSQTGNSTPANKSSYDPVMSAEGRYLAFTSDASNLASSDRNSTSDIFVKDLQTGKVAHVSVSSTGIGADFASDYGSISASGRFVAFQSKATNLVPGDTNLGPDIFVHDRDADADGIYDEPGAISTEIVSIATDGTRTLQTDRLSQRPSISPDGGYVAFASNSSRLAQGDTNGKYDVFLRDRAAGTTERISVSSEEVQGDDDSSVLGLSSAVSNGGRYVAFYSLAANLVPNDFNGNNPLVPPAGLRVAGSGYDVFVRDRQVGSTTRVSLATDGTEIQHFGAGTGALGSSISADGRFVAFESTIFGIVPEDTNTNRDIFVRDRDTDGNGIFDEPGGVATRRVSVTSKGAEATGNSYIPVISADGRYVAFEGGPANLVSSDTNGVRDIFVHDLATAVTERVSIAYNGAEANAASYSPAISGDGGKVAFQTSATNMIAGLSSGTPAIFLRDRGPAVGLRELTATLAGTSVNVTGEANFKATTLASALDAPTDALPGAGPAGAELASASLVYRGEHEDLLARFSLTDLPTLYAPCCVNLSAAGPGPSYTFEFNVGAVRYEMHATTPAGPAPVFELYRCEIVCSKQADLTGSYGTTGTEVLISLPRATLGIADGTALTALRAFTAAGDSAVGAAPYDQVLLGDVVLPAKTLSTAIAPAGTPESQLVFGTPLTLPGSAFMIVLDVSTLLPGAYDVWANASWGNLSGKLAAPIDINAPPVGALLATPTSGAAPLIVSFDGSGSTESDECDRIVSYTFNFGDGSAEVTQTSPTTSHTYTAAGEYTATLRVTDARGGINANTSSTLIRVGSFLSNVSSRKTHGTVGVFDINLPLSGNSGIECRSAGENATYTLVFAFINPLTSVDEASVTSGTATVSSAAIDSSDDRKFVVNLSGVANAQRLKVSLANVNDRAQTNDVSVEMTVLEGDTNGDGAVNSGDAQKTRNRSGQSAGMANFRCDVNTDGSVNSGDAFIVRSKSGSTLNP